MSIVPRPSFTRVRLREGYRIEDVNQFLADIRPLLDGRLPNRPG